MPDLVDYRLITAGFAPWEALEGGEHEVGGVGEVELSGRAVKRFGGRVGEVAILDGDLPLAAPLAVYLNAEGRVDPLCRILVDGRLHQHEHEGHEHARCALVKFGVLVPETPFHVPGMHAVVHYVKCGIKEGGKRSHVWVGDVV